MSEEEKEEQEEEEEEKGRETRWRKRRRKWRGREEEKEKEAEEEGEDEEKDRVGSKGIAQSRDIFQLVLSRTICLHVKKEDDRFCFNLLWSGSLRNIKY